MSERDRQQQQAADDAPREHGEKQVAPGDWPGTAVAWEIELPIAAVIGVIVYPLGTWTAAVLGGVVPSVGVGVTTLTLRSGRCGEAIERHRLVDFQCFRREGPEGGVRLIRVTMVASTCRLMSAFGDA